MKKQLSIICSSLVLGVIAQAATANDGTINFVGGVSDSTCEVTVNGTSGISTQNLPVVSSKLLKTVGDTAGRTFLTFQLKNCGLADGKTKASIFYVAGATINTAGRLDNTEKTNAAKNVQLQILDSNMVAMNLAMGAGAQSVGVPNGTPSIPVATPVVITDGVATIRNAVQYYATAQATAGSVKSSVEYEISYE